MGYEDTTVNALLGKYLDFIPRAPGNLLDLGCAFGFAVEQILTIDKRENFLRQHHRKIIAVDMSPEHLERVAHDTPPELVETVLMHFPNIKSSRSRKAFSPGTLGATYAGLVVHYLNPDELTRGLKLLYAATAPGGRVYASANSAFISPALLEDFQRRKKDPKDRFPGWYPDLFDPSLPEKIRSTMPKSICGIKIKFLHVFDEETLSRYFQQAGFRVVETCYFPRSKTIPMKILGIIAEKKS
jgi:SAM-dependent methyltransferase